VPTDGFDAIGAVRQAWNNCPVAPVLVDSAGITSRGIIIHARITKSAPSAAWATRSQCRVVRGSTDDVANCQAREKIVCNAAVGPATERSDDQLLRRQRPRPDDDHWRVTFEIAKNLPIEEVESLAYFGELCGWRIQIKLQMTSGVVAMNDLPNVV